MTIQWLFIKKFLKVKSSFPKDLIGYFWKFIFKLFRSAKSLVKHLLVADLSKRYGNLKRGSEDIKRHRWFKQLDW